MNKRITLITVLVLVATIGIASFVWWQRHRTPSAEYRIGVVLSLTGRGATYGQRALKGMQLAADELNATEPFRASPIKLAVEDSQSAAPQAVSAFRKVIDVDHVPIAIGFPLSDEVLACAPVANERKVVLLTTAAGSDKIRDAGDYVFRNRESGTLSADAIASACVQRFGLKRIGILYSTSANGVSYRDDFKRAAERTGGAIVAEIGYSEGKTDYHAEIEQLRVQKPQAVYLAGLDQEMGLILKQAKEVGFVPKFFASPGGISQKLIEIAGNAAEGLVSASAPFDLESNDPVVRKFASAYKARFGEDPDFIAANSYDAVHLIASLFKNGATSSDQIRAGLYATKDFPGVGGQTTFDSNGEVSKPISIVQANNGRFVRLQ
jgi:branched-chain amino acid transport system substrate-binding protein